MSNFIVRQLGPLVNAISQARQTLYSPPRTTIAGINDNLWPSPLQPVQPIQPPGAEPLGFGFNYGQNIQYTPRADSEYSAAELRSLARYPLARVCIENNKDILVKMPHRIQLRSLPGETAKERAKRGKGDEILLQLNRFFDNPNPEQTWEEFLRPVLEDMLVIDAASVFLGRDKKTNKIIQLRWIEGGSITRLVEEHGWTPQPPSTAYHQLWQGYPRIDLTTDQLIYAARNICYRGTPSSALYGYSPTEQMAKEIEIGWERMRFVYDFYAEGTIPGLLMFAPVGTSPSTIKEAQDWMDTNLAGNLPKRRRAQIVQGFQEVGKTEQIFQPKEPTLADIFDEIHTRKICFAYGTSPQRLMRQMNRACYSQDTETLTDKGWKLYNRITDDDLVAQFNPDYKSIEYVKPSEFFVYDYSGDMISFKTKTVDTLVTPEHSMWARFFNENKNVVYVKKTQRKSSKRTWGLVNWGYHKVQAGMLNRNCYFQAKTKFDGVEQKTFTIPGVMTSWAKLTYDQAEEIKNNFEDISQQVLGSRYGVDQSVVSDIRRGKRLGVRSSWIDPIEFRMDDWLEFLGYYLSEGRRAHESTCYELGISQKENSPFTPRIDACFARLPLSYSRNLNPSDPTETIEWRVNNKALYNYIKENVGDYSSDKRIPREFLFLSLRQSRILFDALMLGDGSWGEGSKAGRTKLPDMKAATWGSYSTTSPQLASDVQELALKLGYSTFISINRAQDSKHNDCYSVNISMREEHFVSKKKISKQYYTGKVYCFSVPSGLMVTRRNGFVSIQGNSAQIVQEAAEEEGTLPFLNWLKSTMDKVILKMGYTDYEFAFDPFVETDVKKLADADAVDIKNGLYTRNEKRIARGDDPIDEPEADRLSVVTSSGLIPLDKASELADLAIRSKAAGGAVGGSAKLRTTAQGPPTKGLRDQLDKLFSTSTNGRGHCSSHSSFSNGCIDCNSAELCARIFSLIEESK